MKRKLIILLILLSGKTLFAQWEQCVIHGGAVTFVEIIGTRCFAGTYQGLFISDDNALSWDKANNGLPENRSYYSITSNGNEVYVGTNDGEIFKSTDLGDTWMLSNSGLPQHARIWSMLYAGGKVFAANLDSTGVYMSANGGATWVPSLPGIVPTKLAYNNGVIFLGTVMDGIYISQDTGLTWMSANIGLLQQPWGYCYVSSFCANDSIVFAGFDNGGLYASTNHGVSWALCNFPGSNIDALTFFGSQIYAAAYVNFDNIPGVYRSHNGLDWYCVFSGIENQKITSFAVNDSVLLASAFSPYSIYKFDSLSLSWSASYNGLEARDVQAFTNVGNSLFSGDRRAGLFYTNDHGNNWTIQQYYNDIYNVVSMSKYNNQVYVGSSSGLFRTNDYGNTWTMLIYNDAVYGIVPEGNNIIIAASNGLYRSFNNGVTWDLCNINLPNLYYRDLTEDAGNNIYAACGGMAGAEGVYQTDNFGTTWTYAGGGFPGMPYINCITTCGNYLLAGLEYFNPPVVYSDDYGATWQVGNNSLFGLTVRKLKTIEDYVFAATDGGLYYTKTYGADWIDINDNLPDNPIAIGNDHVYVYVSVEYYGVWRRLLSDFNIIVTDDAIHTDLPLVYPNPVTTSLNISAQTINSPFEISVFNSCGIEVSSYISTENTIVLDMHRLAPGLYFLKLQEGDKAFKYKLIKE